MLNLDRRHLLMGMSGAAIAAGTLRVASADDSTAFNFPKYDVADLGGKLTPLGAERAGNAEGTIPEWTGGYSTLPSGYKIGDPLPVPFADEKPILTITPSNYMQYKDKLSAGQIYLLTKNPDFRMDIYQTHRTAIAPQYVYDFTKQNALKAHLSADNYALYDAYGGTPFPLPKSGYELVWNHLLAWEGTKIDASSGGYLVTSSGSLVVTADASARYLYPYYLPDGQNTFDGYYYCASLDPYAPPIQAGQGVVFKYALNPTIQPSRGWAYLLGERRVRETPNLQYDTPATIIAGQGNYDEYQNFNGPMDEYLVTALGKKEMFIPYNVNKAWVSSAEQQYGPRFFNPDLTRWELHRVWVVEMKVRPGRRNVDNRRILYLDEDTWSAVMSDIYDANDTLWKFGMAVPAICPFIPCVALGMTLIYNFTNGTYVTFNGVNSKVKSPWKPVPDLTEQYFSPQALAARSGAF